MSDGDTDPASFGFVLTPAPQLAALLARVLRSTRVGLAIKTRPDQALELQPFEPSLETAKTNSQRHKRVIRADLAMFLAMSRCKHQARVQQQAAYMEMIGTYITIKRLVRPRLPEAFFTIWRRRYRRAQRELEISLNAWNKMDENWDRGLHFLPQYQPKRAQTLTYHKRRRVLPPTRFTKDPRGLNS
jgi:hypothetical protein